jgi:hypothetical protein
LLFSLPLFGLQSTLFFALFFLFFETTFFL